ITFFAYNIIYGCQFSIYICGMLALVSLIPIMLFSPVPNKHKPLSDKQRKKSSVLSIIIASALSVVGLALMALGISFGAMIITTVAMISVLILVETFLQRRGYHEG
ncbi:MAG: accessory gene regulator B family protein, partial [Candidatus Ornithomonoglobus sp.]